MFLTEERAADAAVVSSRKRVDEARSRVKKQLEGMDVLVSGCTIEECNGRFQWVDDQVRETGPCYHACRLRVCHTVLLALDMWNAVDILYIY